MEKSNILTETFGSKKKQRIMVQKLRNNVSNSSVAVTEAIETMKEMGKGTRKL